MVYIPKLGEDLQSIAKRIVQLVKQTGETVTASLGGGVEITATPQMVALTERANLAIQTAN